ncbi:MAG: BREX-1 system adenine-specific DNA-methyltransferase PglX, partial [Clostridiales bacterium]|nr:BREX-1 system adenine-specific DNA-methyltransferase PglX [Clostridiales bacterium]
YIKPAYKDQLPEREKVSIEKIKFFDPCAGSCHILSYAFDVFYSIYEEQGYNASEIPGLIIKNNLYGAEIDERAAQLASFVILMKGREKYRRFFNQIKKQNIQPNIVAYQNFEEDDKFNNATVLGSLINIEPSKKITANIEEGTLFAEKQKALKSQYQILGERYDIVVTNPPYINSSRMEKSLKEYVNENYPDTKSDLFATFILRCLELCKSDGLTGYMTPFVWMFISSYEKLRKGIINNHFINNLIQLEYSGFDGATVPICTFTLRKNAFKDARGSYIRLSDFKGSENQAPKTLEAIQNPQCGWFYTANQKDFEKIPGSPIGYWLSEHSLAIFEKSIPLEEIASPRQGLATTDNERFVRFYFEVSRDRFIVNITRDVAIQSHYKWFPFNKGGEFRKWFGNINYVVDWENNGRSIKSNILRRYSYLKTPDFVAKNQELYFREGITWSAISSGTLSVRKQDCGVIFSNAGMVMFPNKTNLASCYVLNTKISKVFLSVLSPTLNFNAGSLALFPIKIVVCDSISNNIDICINISKTDWDSRETSWDFKQNELIRGSPNLFL